ncbi:MAG TPA: hypothetical protein PLN19_02995 [Methanothrix sp.]|nr:hypothetical protein [Methanothrix sp.]HPC89460.1 hypothetical protein [Methanothrix sp.]HQE87222.1 hypothetical protein [Methanothrix sp.]HQI68662.1 hypothetical protein [Methanothrix sp.]HRS85569.1 hypothetical protein [Methanothrix sp.]
MRHITLVLIALVALSGILPAITAEPAAPVLKDKIAEKATPSESALYTTASIASFLNDSWTPSGFVPPVADQAVGVLRNMTRNNTTLASSTYSIYDFLKDNYTSSAAQSPVYTASAAGKDKTVAWTGESIYDFAQDTWTPGTEVKPYEQSPFKQRQMN